jgi:hypothetical protein
VSQDSLLLAMEKFDLIGDYSTESTLLARRMRKTIDDFVACG